MRRALAEMPVTEIAARFRIVRSPSTAPSSNAARPAMPPVDNFDP